MTPKTKVLKILDKYRDMRLTMGCEVVTKYSSGSELKHRLTKDLLGAKFDEILGHPATPLVLLKALEQTGKGSYLDSIGTLVIFENEHDDQPVQIQIPDVTTLEEIDESDPMWKQLVVVFNLD